ncbi:hypothetical protein NX773_17970 [Massilia solisilvae]|uniref:P-type conjugative transfer protein TrbL n=1 Tax=Massilia solisilvae TaxID=1811225 RepID=A0ABT2BNG3_9BURK|nr:hypothetical protein [Massilia solisilvae]MCS0610058.1 hypothetical protein [Massilia solisilvae]
MILVLFLGLALCSTAAMAAPGTQADMGQFLSQYQAASAKFSDKILTAAKWIAVTLGTIDLTLLLTMKMLNGEGPQEMLVAIIGRVMWYGFLSFLMNISTMTALITGFQTLGEQSSGISVLSPSDIFWQGVDMVSLLMQKFSDSANIGGVPVPAGVAAAANPMVAFLIAIVIILIVGAFLVLTAQYAVILVQMYFYLACYPLIIAMGSIKHGRDMTTKAISGAIVIGVRFLAIYFVLFAAQQLTSAMESQLQNFSIIDLTPMWAVFGSSALLAFIALKAPQMAADLIGGTASLSGGDAVGAATVAGGAVGALAGGAAGLAMNTGSSVTSAIKAGGAAIDQARASGASNFGSLALGAAGALASAGAGAAAEGIRGFGGPSSGTSLADRISSKTASITEAKAAGSPAPSVPGGQPPAPPRADTPAAGQKTVAPVALGTAGAPSANAGPTAVRDTPRAPAAPVATTQTLAPPGPTNQPAQSSAPRQPSVGQDFANNLVNELKQADQAGGAAVNIQAPNHE